MIQWVLSTFRESSVRRPPPLPTMTVHTQHSVPAWVLRAVCAGVLAGCAALVAGSYFALGITLAGALAVALWPWAGVPVTVVGVLAYLYLIAGADQLTAAVLLLSFHVVLVLTRLMGSVGPRARVELVALMRVAVPFALIQAFAQGIMHLAMALPTAGGAAIWLGLVALAGLFALVVALVRALRAVT